MYAILEDNEGNLWVCNGDMLSLLNKQTGQFTHYNSNPTGIQDVDHKTIYSITEDNDGLIWLGTGNGVKSFDKKKRIFEHFYHNPSDTTGISDYTAQAIFADSKDNIWMGFGSIATDRIIKSTGRIVHYKHAPHDWQASVPISSMAFTKTQKAIFGWLLRQEVYAGLIMRQKNLLLILKNMDWRIIPYFLYSKMINRIFG